MNLSEAKLFGMGNAMQQQWNRKLCIEARDTLFDCVAAQPNKNKYRCPDQLYAYEMWCPTEFRLMASQKKRREELDAELYERDWIEKMNRAK